MSDLARALLKLVPKGRAMTTADRFNVTQVGKIGAHRILELEAENARLREALEPFSAAYNKTREAFGMPPENMYTTANCVSQPYIKMIDFANASKAMESSK